MRARWTLSRDVAARFPLLSRYRQRGPLLVTARAARRRALAVKLDRNEVELITLAACMTSIEALRVPA